MASNYGEGWFLPSMADLAAIYENAHITGQGDYFVDNTHNWFWSSTECATNGTAAGDIFFQNGDAYECNNKDSNPGGVIAAKLLHYPQCTYTDSLYVELGTPPPFVVKELFGILSLKIVSLPTPPTLTSMDAWV